MENIILRQIDKIIELCKQAQKVKFPKLFVITINNFCKYSEYDLDNDVKNIDVSNFYICDSF